MIKTLRAKQIFRCLRLLVCSLAFLSSTSWGQALRVCYISDSRSVATDRGYTFDGVRMINNSTPKLTNPANFGPGGIVKRTIVPVPITANPITANVLNTAACGAIFVGSFGKADGTPGTILGSAELDAIKTWSTQSPTNLVVVTQAEANPWGYSSTNGNANPNTPTATGATTKIFNGPFGVVSSFTQGGSYQGSITGGGTAIVLAEDTAKRPTIAYDLLTGDLILGDVDMLTDEGGISSGKDIVTNNDKLFANIWAFANDLTSADQLLAADANTAFVDNGVGGGIAGNCTKDGTEPVPDVSKSPLYVKLISGTAVIQTTPLQSDGSFQFSNVEDGTYTLFLDDNNAVADLTPITTGGTVSWTGTVRKGVPGTRIKYCLLNCVSNLPMVRITGTSSFCLGQTAPLSASASAGSGTYQYQWKQGTTNVGTNSSLFSAKSAGVYSVVVSDGKGCLGTSASLTVTQKPNPDVTVTANGPTGIVSTEFVVLSVSATSGQSYQWSLDGTAISGATSNTFAANQPGDYSVMVTRDGCSDSSTSIEVSIIVAADPGSAGFGLTIYPNPTDGTATIDVSNDAAQPVHVSVFTMTGQTVQTWYIKPSVHQQMLQTELPASGLYILKADNGRSAIETKIIRK